jgi:hypothetical protein
MDRWWFMISSVGLNLVLALWLISSGPKPGVFPISKPLGLESATVPLQNLTALKGLDLGRWVKDLRAAGWPESIVRAVVVAEVNRELGVANASSAGPDFWQRPSLLDGVACRERYQEVLATERQRDQKVQEVLGFEVGPFSNWVGREELRAALDFLPNLKQESVARLFLRTEAAANELQNLTAGVRTPEDYAQWKLIRAQYESELARLLTPEERAEFELRNTSTAQQLRQWMGFEPTEAEYRALAHLGQPWLDAREETFGYVLQSAASDKDKTQAELETKVRETLGDERYAMYRRSQEAEYRELLGVASREQWPPEAASQLYDLQKTAETQAQQIRSQAALNQDQRQEALIQLQSRIRQSAQALLGEAISSSYLNRPASWIESLGTTAAPAGKPPTK